MERRTGRSALPRSQFSLDYTFSIIAIATGDHEHIRVNSTIGVKEPDLCPELVKSLS